MELFRIKHDIPFMSYGRVTTVISAVTFLLAVLFLGIKGLNFGVDFTGGTVLEVSYPRAADLAKVRETLEGMGLKDVSAQTFGTSRDVLIRLPVREGGDAAHLSEQVLRALRQNEPGVEMRRVEFVGPQVGEEMVNNGGFALLLLAAGIMIYLTIRFDWRFAVAAILANLHDVVIILGFFALFQWEFSLTVLAAVLAVLGYSVNESVVVFDRIRENFRTMRKASVSQVIDNAITRTMSRTIMTHAMTETMVVAMLLLGGDVLFYFALALTIGILFGIYSSVLVASPIVMWLGISREHMLIPPKEGADAEPRP